MEYQAIVLGAGNSTRSGLLYNKVLFELNNIPIIYLSTKNFINDVSCSKIFIVCKESDVKKMKEIFKSVDKVEYVIGGKTRQESVNNALSLVDSDYVLIHDGARPYFTPILLNRLIAKLKEYDAVIPVWTMTDTIKVVKNNIVVKTLKRDELKRIQTPQAFKTKIITAIAHPYLTSPSKRETTVLALSDFLICALKIVLKILLTNKINTM